MNLIVVDNKSYHNDFRKYLIRAAMKAGTDAAHLSYRTEITLTHQESQIDSYPMTANPEVITKRIASILPSKKAVIMVGLGSSSRCIALVRHLRRSFTHSIVFYDAFDHFGYNLRGLLLLKARALDCLWRYETDQTLVLEKGLLQLYPKAIHFDNASHLEVSDNHATRDDEKIVYIGSIDCRTDFGLLAALAKLDITLDIYGRVHEDDAEIQKKLDDLTENYENILYHSAYDNDDLSAILSKRRIGIIPYKTNQNATVHVNPDKLYHYLNAGLEVIATPIPQVKRMAGYLHLVATGEDLPAAIAAARTTRRQAQWPRDQYTWGKRWEQLSKLFLN